MRDNPVYLLARPIQFLNMFQWEYEQTNKLLQNVCSFVVEFINEYNLFASASMFMCVFRRQSLLNSNQKHTVFLSIHDENNYSTFV